MTDEIVPGDYTPQIWDPFRGNNHHTLAPSEQRYGGRVSFACHLGKPLSAELWQDLYQRLGMRSLRIYRSGDCEWTDGRWPYAVDIYLDAAGNVRDIEWAPPRGDPS